MLRTLGVVEIPPSAAGTKAAWRRRLGGKTLLEWVVRRVTEAERLDGVVVAASEDDADAALVTPSDVPVHCGNQADQMARLTAVLEAYPAEALVRVRLTSPFVDPALLDRLIATADAHPECDYIGYCSRDGRPAIWSPVGVFGEWIKAKALRKSDRRAQSPAERSDVTGFVCGHPESFQLRLIPAPAQLLREDVRLTIDREEDWDHAQDILDALGAESLDWQHVAALLDHQPQLRHKMAKLNRESASQWA